jgi:hypothetical protein
MLIGVAKVDALDGLRFFLQRYQIGDCDRLSGRGSFELAHRHVT